MTIKRLSAEARKGQIANIAASLFARRGFNGVTTREIAKKAKVNEAIIFRHFPTKEALYTEIIDQKVHFEPAVFDLKTAEHKSDEDVFCSVAEFMVKETEEDNTFLRLMLYSALEGHGLSALFIKKRSDVLVDFLTDYAESRIKEGGFKPIDARIVIRAFIGMIFHFILMREIFRVPKKLQVPKTEAIKKFVDIFLEGVRVK